MEDPRSAKDLLGQWEGGDEAAAEEIYRRYAQRLCALAQSQIGERLARRVGPDDIVQSVFRTFFRRTRDGQFVVDNSGSLWRLLVQITLNKVRRQSKRHLAGRRSMAAEVHPSDDSLEPTALAREPSPDEAAALTDEIEFVLGDLKSPEPEIFRLGLQGYSPSEIAAQIGCSRWTARRVLNRIGRRLEARLRGDTE
jgi:RNA polymerase sigma-70 factor (ECF subfamily)